MAKLSRVMIVGAGEAGQMVISEINKNKGKLNRKVVALVDDDDQLIGQLVCGKIVDGKVDDIPTLVKKFMVDEIIFSIANISNKRKKEIIDICRTTSCYTKTIPSFLEIIDGKVDFKLIRDVEIDDLLGRDPVSLDMDKIRDYISDKIVMVTGAGGTIGSELCRQIYKYGPSKLVLLDNYENNVYSIQQELVMKYENQVEMDVVIANVREEKRLDQLFSSFKPDIVFHAAAHKHVPLMEANPTEAVKNNVFGTLNLLKVSDKYKVKKFVLISTDKAVNPTNIMGATKRLAEKLIQIYNGISSTDYVAVRFGNVLGSNGSVVPLFKKQLMAGGPVTVTHKDIIRYFMTIPEAVALVMQAGAMAHGGEIFVLDMGDPVKIDDLARNMIRLSGFEPDVDIDIVYTGLRPGEKLYEELLMAEEGLKVTDHNKIFIGSPQRFNEEEIFSRLADMKAAAVEENSDKVVSLLKILVDTYRNPDDVNKLI